MLLVNELAQLGLGFYILKHRPDRLISIIHVSFQNQTLINGVLFYVAAASTFIAGVLHLAIIPMFFALTPVNVMIFFLVSGAAQLFWVIPVLKRWSNLWYYSGMGGTAILIALFVIAVPARGLPLSELEITIEVIQIVFIISSIMIVKERSTKAELAPGRES
jgi:hypothetical protein